MKKLIIVCNLILILSFKIIAQANDIEIYKNNFRELLCFEQETNEKSGITKVSVILSPDIQSNITTFKWVAKSAGINLIYKTKTSVMIQAVSPGRNSVIYEAYDKNAKSLGKVEIPLSVPQFVNIFEYTIGEYDLVENAIPYGVNKAKARKFDEVLKYAGLLSYKKEIYKESIKLAESYLKECNVRLLLNDFGENLPAFVDTNKIFKLRIGGFARDYDLKSLRDSLNYSRGLTYIGNLASFIAPGRLTDMSTPFAKTEIDFGNHSYAKIMLYLKNNSISESKKKAVFVLWKKIFTKALGIVIAHEIGHNLLQLPGDGHTNVTRDGDDIMSKKYDDLDIGFIISNKSFPEGKSYEWINQKGFNKHNLGLLQNKHPIASNPIFKEFSQ